ncbi:MAG TPA: hypothetical protein VHV80_06500 [Steroidobacteraceae bacterium]|nr:hypothetical protein [Steroidobacteraceae bacterium]
MRAFKACCWLFACAQSDPLTIPLGLEENPFNRHDTVGGALREYFLGTYLEFWQELRNGARAWRPARSAAERRMARFIGSS